MTGVIGRRAIPLSRLTPTRSRQIVASVDVLLLFALPFELEPTADRLGLRDEDGAGLRVGETARHRIRAAVTGVGRARADAACRELVERRRPEWVLFSGFAGGLAPDLAVGDLICPERVVLWEGERFDEERPSTALPALALPADAGFSSTLARAAAAAGARLSTGPLVTVDRAVRDPAHKRALGATTAAVAVDMESAASVACAAELGIPCTVVRAISDAADDTIPEGLHGLIGPDGAVRPAEFERISHEPELRDALRRLAEAGQRAARSLADVFEACLSP